MNKQYPLSPLSLLTGKPNPLHPAPQKNAARPAGRRVLETRGKHACLLHSHTSEPHVHKESLTYFSVFGSPLCLVLINGIMHVLSLSSKPTTLSRTLHMYPIDRSISPSPTLSHLHPATYLLCLLVLTPKSCLKLLHGKFCRRGRRNLCWAVRAFLRDGLWPVPGVIEEQQLSSQRHTVVALQFYSLGF